MPSRIVCDGGTPRLGRSCGRVVEAREWELVGDRWVGGVAGGVEVLEGGGEMGEDGEPDRELDGVLGVAEESGQVELVLEPAEEELDLPVPEVDLDDLGGVE